MDVLQVIDKFGLGVVMALGFLWAVHYTLTVTLPRMLAEQTAQLKSQQDIFVSTLANLERRWDAREERRDKENEKICAQMSAIAAQVSDLIRVIKGTDDLMILTKREPDKLTSKESR